MKNLTYAMKEFFRNYFKLNGRLSRAGYWWAFLGYLIIAIICSILNVVLDTGIFTTVLQIATFIPWFTATARRYHDCGRSTGFLVLMYVLEGVFGFMIFGSLVGIIFGAYFESDSLFGGSLIATGVGAIGVLAVTIISFIGLVKPSVPGENKWGAPNPFDPDKDDKAETAVIEKSDDVSSEQ